MAEQTKINLWATIPPWILATAAIIGLIITLLRGNAAVKQLSIQVNLLRDTVATAKVELSSMKREADSLRKLVPPESRDGTRRIVMTDPNLRERNNWDDAEIRRWMAHPNEGFVGTSSDDKQFPISGRVNNPPGRGFVRLSVILTGTDRRSWPQGDCALGANGQWDGFVVLRVGPTERFAKTVRAELYEGEDPNAKTTGVRFDALITP